MPDANHETQPETLNLTDSAEALGVTRYTVLNLALLGRIGYIASADSKIRFIRADVEALARQGRRIPKLEASIA